LEQALVPGQALGQVLVQAPGPVLVVALGS
jgi:hypothetical protein